MTPYGKVICELQEGEKPKIKHSKDIVVIIKEGIYNNLLKNSFIMRQQ